jgi:hypothetical protein
MIALLGLWPEEEYVPPVIGDPRDLDPLPSGTLPAAPSYERNRVEEMRRRRRRQQVQAAIAAVIGAFAQGVLT